MHKLKERLEPIKLSEVQKERLLRNVKQVRVEPERHRGWKLGPLIASGIVAVAMVLIVVGLLTEPASLFERGADTSTANEDGWNYSLKTLILAGVTTILMFISFITLWRNLQLVKRWQTNVKLQKLRAFMENKVYYVTIYIIMLAIIWSGALLLSWSQLYVEFWFGAFFVFCIFMWQVWLTRDLEWCKCPHCGELMTRKAIRKKTMWQYRETCDACGELIYFKMQTSNIGVISIPISFFIYFSVFNVNSIVSILMIAVMVWLTLHYITPYTYEFSKEKEEQKNLW